MLFSPLFPTPGQMGEGRGFVVWAESCKNWRAGKARDFASEFAAGDTNPRDQWPEGKMSPEI